MRDVSFFSLWNTKTLPSSVDRLKIPFYSMYFFRLINLLLSIIQIVDECFS